MPDIVKLTERFVLTVDGYAMSQDPRMEDPQFSNEGGSYLFMKRTEPEVRSFKSGDEVWIVNEAKVLGKGLSYTYWTMPNSELRATQDQRAATRFTLLKTGGSEGAEIRFGDTILAATAALGQWIGVSPQGHQLQGHPTTPGAAAIVLLPLGTTTPPPPFSELVFDWCIRIHAWGAAPGPETFHGTYAAAYARMQEIRKTVQYNFDYEITAGRCPGPPP